MIASCRQALNGNLSPACNRKALEHTAALVQRTLLRRRFAALRAVASRRRYVRVALARAEATRQRRMVRSGRRVSRLCLLTQILQLCSR